MVMLMYCYGIKIKPVVLGLMGGKLIYFLRGIKNLSFCRKYILQIQCKYGRIKTYYYNKTGQNLTYIFMASLSDFCLEYFLICKYITTFHYFKYFFEYFK